ncbi:hypothetical protein [Streptomyces sp. NBC_00557]|uniref:hypothetical protein n=1 Tax=Streptomyces sp. NBC_00557 TaxID=2975776 RepID=UPI002E7FC428|nr:hypothetical protein [Streptomyces sp. NBC_00557]WUC39664.1 hypothetical protein OG956_38555 [Streptomyces sp. NBC_00557]
MTTAIRSELRTLITAAQQAIRDCEEHPAAGTLGELKERLENFPGDDLDQDAFDALDKACRLLSEAITCPEMSSTLDVIYAMNVMLRDGAEAKPEEEPTVAAVVVLTSQCLTHFQETARTDIAKTAWERAYCNGVAAIAVLTKELPGYPDDWDQGVTHRVNHAVEAFLAAVRRAVAYRALYVARDALVDVAESALLFPIGGRQPVRGMEGLGWSRRIGGALYVFEVTGRRPLEKAPAGMIVATRVDLETGQREERHALPRTFGGGVNGGYGKHRAAEDKELERI